MFAWRAFAAGQAAQVAATSLAECYESPSLCTWAPLGAADVLEGLDGAGRTAVDRLHGDTAHTAAGMPLGGRDHRRRARRTDTFITLAAQIHINGLDRRGGAASAVRTSRSYRPSRSVIAWRRRFSKYQLVGQLTPRRRLSSTAKMLVWCWSSRTWRETR